jgi:D-galactarolactone cycloisomerase
MPRIRITGVKAHHLVGKLKQRFGWSLNWTDKRDADLIEVTTDAGLTGWGEGSYAPELLRQDKALVIGRSPFEVEAIFEDLRPPARGQSRMGPPAGAGIDVALWDIVGQALGKPVYQLLGHPYRTRVQPYCTGLYRKDWPDLAAGLAAEAQGWKDRGFKAMKMKVGYGPDIDVEIVRAVRKAIGPDIGLGADANCAYDAGSAVALGRQLEEFDLMWWEEPLWADDLSGYARLKRSLKIPLAGGESSNLDWLIRNYVKPQLLDIVQPELTTVGLTGGRILTHLCQLNKTRLVPHNWGSALRTVGELHWMACCPPMSGALTPPPVMFEFDQTENPFRDAVLKQKITIDKSDGCIGVPTQPGLGINIVREAVDEFRTNLVTFS